MVALDTACIHSGCMATTLRAEISRWKRTAEELAAELDRRKDMDDSEFPDGIGFENLALWCEITEHAFSAKDEDKVVMNYRGKKRLACGPCAGGIFSIPEPPSGNGPQKTVRAALDTRADR